VRYKALSYAAILFNLTNSIG